MKTRGARIVFLVSAVCLCLGPGRLPAGSAGPGEDAAGGGDKIARAYALIDAQAGTLPSESAPLPVVKRDRQGKVWGAWEELQAGRSRIRLASFGDAGSRIGQDDGLLRRG